MATVLWWPLDRGHTRRARTAQKGPGRELLEQGHLMAEERESHVTKDRRTREN